MRLVTINGIATNEQKTQVFSKQTTHRIAELLDAVVSLKGSGLFKIFSIASLNTIAAEFEPSQLILL
jgi:hypothetical protein